MMKHTGSCQYFNDNGSRCDSTYNLHHIYFHDPYMSSNSFLLDLCQWDASKISDELMYRAREYQMRLANMIAERGRMTKIARENGIYRRNEFADNKIEDLKSLIKNLQNNECKNIFCRNNLRKLDNNTKLYSVIFFKPSGRRWYTFYFCSIKCYNNMRAKCGGIELNYKQTLLETNT